MIIIKAKSLYHTGQYDKAITQLRKARLNNEDKLLLASAYAKNRRNDQAKAVLQPLLDNTELKAKALLDQSLAPLVREIERERLEQQRLEQQRFEQQRLEQQRLEQQRLEQQRLEQQKLEQQKLEQEKQPPVQENTQKQGENS